MSISKNLQVVERARAPPQITLREVIQVNPRVGSVFLSLDHRGGGMMRAGILGLGFAVHDARPDQRATTLGLHFDAQVGEDGLAAFLDVREVQEECEDTRTAG